MDILKKRKQILYLLEKKKIPCVLIGGLAVNIHGSSRMSYDFDLAARIQDNDAIIDLMYPTGFRIPVKIVGEKVTWANNSIAAKKFSEENKLGALNFHMVDPKTAYIQDEIDFVFENPLPFPRLKQRAIRISENPLLLCACIDDLITMKRKRIREGKGKMTDRVDLEFLLSRKKEMKK